MAIDSILKMPSPVSTATATLATAAEPPAAYLEVFQISTASVSFFASSLMVFAITCMGNIRLSTPYRRILFGLSISDILQSLALLMGPSSVPKEKFSSAEPGNEVASCQANGFMLSVGASAVMLYTLFLCLYYLCKLRYRMSDDAFNYKFERKLHIFIMVLCVGINTAALVMDTFHIIASHPSFCYFDYVPTGCQQNSDEECDPKNEKAVLIFLSIHAIAMTSVCFVGIVTSMGLLLHHTFLWNQTIKKELSVPTSLRSETAAGQEDHTPAALVVNNEQGEKTMTPQDTLQHLSRLYRREMITQACCYVGTFCIVYIPTGLAIWLSMASISNHVLDAVAGFTYPLGGFLNILVYTRPKISGLRRIHPELSWMRSLWLVLRAGGEIPNDVDLSSSCWESCCLPPAWLDSEWERASSAEQDVRLKDSQAPTSIHLSRIGFVYK